MALEHEGEAERASGMQPVPSPPGDTVVQVVIEGLTQQLSYLLPARLHSGPSSPVGCAVDVPLGRTVRPGWVVGTQSNSEELESALARSRPRTPTAPSQTPLFGSPDQGERALKSVVSVTPLFRPDQLPLFEWMASYYGVPLSEVFASALPSPMAAKEAKSARVTIESTDEAISQALAQLARSATQRRVFEFLLERAGNTLVRECADHFPSASAALKALAAKGLVALETTAWRAPVTARPPSPALHSPDRPELSLLQQTAFEKMQLGLRGEAFSPYLLFGVTGSGKTEVYLRAVEEVLETGGSALIIVPEISLTPQLLSHVERRLGAPPAVLHSQLGSRARWDAWVAALEGRTRVAIGARSAVFTPLERLRLIIVDEEHDSSYKQSEGLRYHGRDVAVMRAKLQNATVVLGSATPSFESLFNASNKRYVTLQLPERVTPRPLPSLEVVNLASIKRSQMPSELLSPQLYDALKETLARKEQAVILYNRRGYASFLQCTTCGEALHCSQCSVTLTYHRAANRVLCHFCSSSSSPPPFCPLCRDPRTSQVQEDYQVAAQAESDPPGTLQQCGGGTERVVDELAALFPDARLARMDRDTVTKKDSYETILNSMRARESDILVGTQMIAKGHDLPGVTLVGIIDADVGLHVPDFRASERIYQLVTQAAGRAGRGTEPGRVILQTRQPTHPTIVAVTKGRFTAFARYEIDYRRSLGYPPCARLLRLIVSSPDREEAYHAAAITRSKVDELIRSVTQKPSEGAETNRLEQDSSKMAPRALGPAPAPYERLRGRFRWHILVKAGSAQLISTLARHLNMWKGQVKGFKDFRLSVDVDPFDML